MAQPTQTFFDELIAAARGCVALLTGRRNAPDYFDFSQRGLVGSFIALVLSLAVQAFGPQLIGISTPPGVSMSVVILASIVTAMQFGIAFVVLRLLGRNDGFVPFVVVQNWATLFQGILAVTAIGVFGQPFAMNTAGEAAQLTSGSIPFVVLGIAALVMSVNIARLIVTLRPTYVALFVASQLGTALVLQLMLGSMF
ncbi:hypothetical protein [Devosia sp. FKR38]|uniref:hypothetical protein n=1 Tax=Devosia sp. FKR38 TaxID=2562312 RepID=UPI0010C14499|nr:hypothetical protein [Devosia sp. FKR38]